MISFTIFFHVKILICCIIYNKRYLGGYSIGVPPLPIPNREVKPYSADGTA